MVDPWKHWSTFEYFDSTNVLQTDQDNRYKSVQHMAMEVDEIAASRAAILRLTSDEAADLIPDSSLVSNCLSEY
jgi:hypothetical protein